MKINVLNLIVALILVIAAFSCSDGKINEEEKLETDNRKIETIDSTEIKYNAMKDEYKLRIKEKILEADKKIEELSTKFNNANGKLKDKLKLEIDEWKIKKQKLQEAWEKIEKLGKENWNNFEKELKNALDLK